MGIDHRRRILRETLTKLRLGLPQHNAPPPRSPPGSRHRPAPRRSPWKDAGLELIHEIVATADRVRAACDREGQPIFRSDGAWRLARLLERWDVRPSISDAARRLGISRQAARDLVVSAQRAGHIELFRSPTDRRLIQMRLSDAGRRALERARGGEAVWITLLLNGLDTPEIRAMTHVLSVIRRRLR